MNVLIVDDQFVNRYLLEKILIGNGFAVFSAENGYDALEIAKTTHPDLIISDILLPRMDGFQFCRELKTIPELKHIPFVFYTAAYTEKKDQDFAESLGADRFIIKPTDPVAFIAIIRELLSDIPPPSETEGRPEITNGEYLSAYNSRLFRQLEKKLLELEEVNKALRISEERYRNLFEQANDAILLHIMEQNRPGRILEANEYACHLLGYTRDELLRMDVSGIDSPAMAERYAGIISAFVAIGDYTFEGEFLTKDDRIIPVEIHSHLFPDPKACICLSICRDITDRKKAEKDITRAFLTIEQNMYNMAVLNDKIRNPLSIILSNCEACNGTQNGPVCDAVQSIDQLITQIDDGWIESEKVRNYLSKYYKIHTPKSEADDR